MAVFMAFLLVLLAMVGYSYAAYCICKDGVSSDQLQKDIDYACGNGADCSQILQSGSCYNPNTVKDHCSYAVNSYYQKKSSTGATCDFSGTASISQTAPNTGTGCSYPSSSGNTGTVTPNNNPSINAPPGSSINNPITTPTGGTNTGSPGFGGIGPSGGNGGIDNNSSPSDCGLLYKLLSTLAFCVLVLGLNWFRI